MKQFTLTDRIAKATGLDSTAAAIRDLVAKVLRPGAVKDALHGVWLGHPLHPSLVQLPVGCFTAAALMDLTGERDAAAKLIRWGVLGSVPAAAAGLADYADSHEEQQRVGVVHAGANSAALLGYLVSLRLRATGRGGLGTAVGLVSFAFSATGAALGGDLSFRHAVGANHAAEVAHTGPGDWCDLGPTAEFSEQPVRRMAGLIPVVVLRANSGIAVLHDRCSHLAAPLHEGTVSEVDGAACLQCPWHGSVFRIADGAVVHGPATAPQPVLHTMVRKGRLLVRVDQFPGVPAS